LTKFIRKKQKKKKTFQKKNLMKEKFTKNLLKKQEFNVWCCLFTSIFSFCLINFLNVFLIVNTVLYFLLFPSINFSFENDFGSGITKKFDFFKIKDGNFLKKKITILKKIKENINYNDSNLRYLILNTDYPPPSFLKDKDDKIIRKESEIFFYKGIDSFYQNFHSYSNVFLHPYTQFFLNVTIQNCCGKYFNNELLEKKKLKNNFDFIFGDKYISFPILNQNNSNKIKFENYLDIFIENNIFNENGCFETNINHFFENLLFEYIEKNSNHAFQNFNFKKLGKYYSFGFNFDKIFKNCLNINYKYKFNESYFYFDKKFDNLFKHCENNSMCEIDFDNKDTIFFIDGLHSNALFSTENILRNELMQLLLYLFFISIGSPFLYLLYFIPFLFSCFFFTYIFDYLKGIKKYTKILEKKVEIDNISIQDSDLLNKNERILNFEIDSNLIKINFEDLKEKTEV
jgi:hypothetical protein